MEFRLVGSSVDSSRFTGVTQTTRSAREVLGLTMTDTVKSSYARSVVSLQGSVKFLRTTCRITVPGTSKFPAFGLGNLFTGVTQTTRSAREVLGLTMTATVKSSYARSVVSLQGSAKILRATCRITVPGTSSIPEEKLSSNFLKDKKLIPYSDPPSSKDVELLYQFFEQSTKLVVLTGAGISTECGIPDYRSPNGVYSSGFEPFTHQEFLRSSGARRRYWVRSYAVWRRFTASQPGAAHVALASLEKASRIYFMITQNADRLHHRAGSNPLELHGTFYTVVCLDCSFSFSQHLFQEQLKDLNPKWAAAIESLDYDSRSYKNFGMKQRPDGDIEIDEKFWEEDFHIPACQKCGGVVKPEVVFFGDNVPKDRADEAMEAAEGCDAFLVLGSSLKTRSALRLVRAAHEAGAATAIVNVGVTQADDLVSLKINARLGEVLPRLLNVGSLSIPAL